MGASSSHVSERLARFGSGSSGGEAGKDAGVTGEAAAAGLPQDRTASNVGTTAEYGVHEAPVGVGAGAAYAASAGATATAPPPVLVVRFSGSGWLLAFHCGVGKFLHDHLQVDHHRLRFGGQSGGSLISCALTAGMDVDCVYEAALEMYEPCKYNAFKMRKCLLEALDRLAPPDEAWRNSRHRLIVGLSRIEHLGGARLGWKSTNVTEFRGRRHGLKVLEASCHLPVISGVRGVKVDGNRFFDGGLAELVPDISPEQIGLNSDPAAGPVDPVASIDVCAWGNLGEGYHICPGFEVPMGWFFFPHNPGVLNKLFRLGYCRAAECFAKIDPIITADLWRPGMELGDRHLPGIVAQMMLASRKKYSKPRPELMQRLKIKQLAVPETEDVLATVAQKHLVSGLRVRVPGLASSGSCASPLSLSTLGGVRLPDTPNAVTTYLHKQHQQAEQHVKTGKGAASGCDGAGQQGAASGAVGGDSGAHQGQPREQQHGSLLLHRQVSSGEEQEEGCQAAELATVTSSSLMAKEAAAAVLSAARRETSVHARPGTTASSYPKHALRPLPPLAPTSWLKDEELRKNSLASMAAGSFSSNKVAPLPVPMPSTPTTTGEAGGGRMGRQTSHLSQG